MEALIEIVLVWFILGFLAQLFKYPREDIILSSGRVKRFPGDGGSQLGTFKRKEKIFIFWVIWFFLGSTGVAFYLDRISFTF